MSSWIPDLPHLLAPHGLSCQVVEPGARFDGPATALVACRQFGPTHTLLLVDEDDRPVALFELVRHPDTLWINRVQVLGELVDVAVFTHIFAAVQDAAVELAVDRVWSQSAPESGLDPCWKALGFEAHTTGRVSWRVERGGLTIQGTGAGTVATFADFGAVTEAESVGDSTEATEWVASGKALPGNRFVVRELLGRGAIGEVWAADDVRLGSSVALKVMRAEHVGRPKYRLRFEQEVRVTAQLDHPGVVTVVDSDQLPDGRLWFVMDRVRGDNLLQVQRLHPQVLRTTDPAAADQWVRKTATMLQVVAQAVASAHARGVVHRDIKPANIMVGRFGEVLLMDWGVARNLAEDDAYFDVTSHPIDLSLSESELTTRMGQRVGTPAYMAPEQARGEAQQIGPPADVFCLGVTLFEMLTGRLPIRRGVDADPRFLREQLAKAAVPVSLRVLIEDCLAPIPADRPTAATFATELGRYLDGTVRREQADALFREVQPKVAETAHRMAAAEARRRAALSFLAMAPRVGPAEPRIPGWRMEDEAEEMLGAALQHEAVVERRLQSALELWEGHTGARRALTDLYLARAARLDELGTKAEVLAVETTLADLDDPRAAAFLRAEGAVTLFTDPDGAEVVAHRQAPVDRRLTTVESIPLGRTPLVERTLGRGSWILEIKAPGRMPVQYPVMIGRGEHWHGVPPGENAPFAIPLPKVGELGPEDCYVPAGWARLGGDPDAIDGIPARRMWVDGMVARKFPVTFDEWFEWIDAENPDIPDRGTGVGHPGEDLDILHLFRRVPGGIEGGGHVDRALMSGRHPVSYVSRLAALGYARWLRSQTGRAWQLPTEWMWEKAARGVDGRIFSWGNHFDGSRAISAEQTGSLTSKPVDDVRDDVGPYGLAHMCGLVRVFCSDRFIKDGGVLDGVRVPMTEDEPIPEGAWACARGGAFHARRMLTRIPNRYVVRNHQRYTTQGLRLFAAYGPEA